MGVKLFKTTSAESREGQRALRPGTVRTWRDGEYGRGSGPVQLEEATLVELD